MATVFRQISDQWHFLMEEGTDERTRGWFLAGSPFPPIIIMIVYYRLVKKIGPELMKNRKPFNLDKIIQIYNVIQVLLCSWLFYEGFSLTYGPFGHYSYRCQPMDKSKSPLAYKIASITWMYYMLKIFDLLDTIFFVLRKKFNQVSVLHVYHHLGVIILGYIATKYFPDGQGFFLVCVNNLVHIFMYSYYFITNYNPEYRKNLWWKKYITQMQIVQFLAFTVQFGKVFFMPDCQYPRLPFYLYLPQNFIILSLFINFYIKTYVINKPVKAS